MAHTEHTQSVSKGGEETGHDEHRQAGRKSRRANVCRELGVEVGVSRDQCSPRCSGLRVNYERKNSIFFSSK